MSFPLLRLVAFALVGVLPLVPVRAAAAGDQTVTVSGNDQMKFDTTDIGGQGRREDHDHADQRRFAAQDAMAHNIVVLKPGTDVMAFIAAASAGSRATAGYLPDGEQASRIIVHTKLLRSRRGGYDFVYPDGGGRVRIRLHVPGPHGGGDAREDHRAMSAGSARQR